MFTAIAMVVVPAAMAGVSTAMEYTDRREKEIDQSIKTLKRFSVAAKAKKAKAKDLKTEKYTWLNEIEFGGPVLLTDQEFSWWVREGHLDPDPRIIKGILKKQARRREEEGCA